MKRIGFLLLAVITVAIVAYMAHASGQSDADSSPIYGVKIPAGYRDWQLISVNQLHFAGKGEQLRAQLGNDIAIRPSRNTRSHSQMVPSLPQFIGPASRPKRITRSLMFHFPARNRS